MRIIAKLEVKDSYLVKGMQYEGLKKIGNINDITFEYSQKGFHELMFSDVMASLYGRNRIDKIIGEFSKHCSIPIAAGGGISNINIAGKLISNGADKVMVNSYLFDDLNLLSELAHIYGEQAIIISIQARRVVGAKRWKVMKNAGRENTGMYLDEWLSKIKHMPFGELMISSIDNDGMLTGIDKDLLQTTRDRITNHPIIYSGGIGTLDHLVEAEEIGADAVAIAKAFHEDNGLCSCIDKYLLNDVSSTKTLNTSINLVSKKVSILDLKLGNIASLVNCFSDIGYSVEVVDDLFNIQSIDRLVLPGVGHISQAINSLMRNKLDHKIKEYVALGKPILGICLGMHLMGNKSEEDNSFNLSGIGLFGENIYQLGIPNCSYKLPNVAWKSVEVKKGSRFSPGVFYHIHKFAYTSVNESSYDEIGTSSFYDQTFYSYLRKDNVIGFQFHPEKSGANGRQAIIKCFEQ